MSAPSRLHELIARYGSLLGCLIEKGPMTRGQLGAALGVAQPTITRRTMELIESNILCEGEVASEESRLGRPSRLLDIVPDAAYVAALHLGRSDVELGLVNLKGEVVAKETMEGGPQEEENPARFIDEAVEALGRLWAASGVPRERVLGLGVATTGVFDPATGTDARFWLADGRLVRTDVPVRQRLLRTVTLPTVIETNAWAMAMGDRWFGNRERDFALFHANDGAAAAIVVNGSLYRGQGAAGEIAHNRVGDNRSPCSCGKRGCLAAVISRSAIVAKVSRVHKVRTIWDVVALANQRDPDVLEVLAECAEAVGPACTSIVDLLDPKALVLSGPIFSVPLVFNAVEEYVRQNSFTGRTGRVQVLRSPLGADIALVGAASLVLDALLKGEGRNGAAEGRVPIARSS